MPYSREDMDWLEAEWAYHLHGRSAFMSLEDFRQLQAWQADGVPADAVVSAMEAFFQRRAKRAKARSFVALEHLKKDVEKAVKLRQALERAGTTVEGEVPGWDGVKPPLSQDPEARRAFEAWVGLKRALPLPDAPGFLEHFDAERKAYAQLVICAEAKLGPRAGELRQELEGRLEASKIPKDGPVWKRAWTHHWGKMVTEAWGIPTPE